MRKRSFLAGQRYVTYLIGSLLRWDTIDEKPSRAASATPPDFVSKAVNKANAVEKNSAKLTVLLSGKDLLFKSKHKEQTANSSILQY